MLAVDKENADAPSKRQTQYFEIFGNRVIYHDGWIAATTPPAGPWEMVLLFKDCSGKCFTGTITAV